MIRGSMADQFKKPENALKRAHGACVVWAKVDAEYRNLTSAQRAEHRERCRNPEETAISEIMDNEDCQGFVEYFSRVD